ncbi:MAG: HlyD family secretion protein [Gammaproteobacteria bacterium]|nr:HlyD family secretion protein [Gammaproteobacteria bacterium]
MSAQLKEIAAESIAPGSQLPARPSMYNKTNITATLILIMSTLWLANWFYQRAGHVYVSDARIASTMIAVSSRISGWIDEFPVEEGQFVRVDSVLARIDQREARLRLAELDAQLKTIEAEYAQVESQKHLVARQADTRLEAQRSKFRAAEAALSEVKVTLAQTESDWQRARLLLDEQIISREIWESRKSDFERGREQRNRMDAEVAIASAALLEAEANLARVDVLENQLKIITNKIAVANSKRDQLLLNLDDHIIRSSINGYIDETFVNAGEYVSRGQRILVSHDPDNIWIKANVKETEIRHIQVGTPVNILVDAYPDRVFRGEVSSIGNAATSQFALLPNPNPSGNFTKITQRVEVHVSIDQIDNLLKPGMMVELEFDSS